MRWIGLALRRKESLVNDATIPGMRCAPSGLRANNRSPDAMKCNPGIGYFIRDPNTAPESAALLPGYVLPRTRGRAEMTELPE